jgi:hypothetical protein
MRVSNAQRKHNRQTRKGQLPSKKRNHSKQNKEKKILSSLNPGTAAATGAALE